MEIRWLPWRSIAEFNLLVTLLAAAAALFGFALIADAVTEGETGDFDTRLLLAFRNPADLSQPIGPDWLHIAVRDLTGLGDTTILALVTLIVIGYLLVDGKRGAAAFVAISIISGTLLSFGLKWGFERPRPDLVAHLVKVHTMSFPSGHAMMSALTYLTLGALLARTQSRRRIKAYVLGVAVALTLLIGISRVYLGVHWPTDVLAGWCAGSAWALMCWLIVLWLQGRGRIEDDKPEAAPSSA